MLGSYFCWIVFGLWVSNKRSVLPLEDNQADNRILSLRYVIRLHELGEDERIGAASPRLARVHARADLPIAIPLILFQLLSKLSHYRLHSFLAYYLHLHCMSSDELQEQQSYNSQPFLHARTSFTTGRPNRASGCCVLSKRMPEMFGVVPGGQISLRGSALSPTLPSA